MSEKIGKVFGEFLEKEIFNEEKVQEKQPVEPTKVKCGNFIDRGDYIELKKPAYVFGDMIHAIEKYGSPTRLSYSEAIDYCEKLNIEKLGGLDDWRIPNISELEAIQSFQDLCGIKFKGSFYVSTTRIVMLGQHRAVLGHKEDRRESVLDRGPFYVICIR